MGTAFRRVINEAVTFGVDPNSPCPCGTKIPASRCCLTDKGFIKKPACTIPNSPKTQNSRIGCYASLLKDCSSTLSREHFISESLLHLLNKNSDLRASGLAWLSEGEEKILPPNALASNILCTRHNSALSSLDSIAVRLFQAFNEENAAHSGNQELYLFSGHDIERWLLKILCGLVYSGNFTHTHKNSHSLDEKWLEILFGYAEFGNEQGFYVCNQPGERHEGPRGVKVGVIEREGQISGIGVWVCGYELILSMNGFPKRIFDGRSVVYRPLEFYTVGPSYEKSIVLSWNGNADLGTISLQVGET